MPTVFPTSLDVSISINKTSTSTVVDNTNLIFIDADVPGMGTANLIGLNGRIARATSLAELTTALPHLTAQTEVYNAASTFFAVENHPKWFTVGNISTKGVQSFLATKDALSPGDYDLIINDYSGITNGCLKFTVGVESTGIVECVIKDIAIEEFVTEESLTSRVTKVCRGINESIAQSGIKVGDQPLGDCISFDAFTGQVVINDTYFEDGLRFAAAAKFVGSKYTISTLTDPFPGSGSKGSMTSTVAQTMEALVQASISNIGNGSFQIAISNDGAEQPNPVYVPVPNIHIPEFTADSDLVETVTQIKNNINTALADVFVSYEGPEFPLSDLIEFAIKNNEASYYFQVNSKVSGTSIVLYPLQAGQAGTDLSTILGLASGNNPTIVQGEDNPATYLGRMMGLDADQTPFIIPGNNQSETFSHGLDQIQKCLNDNNIPMFGYTMSSALTNANNPTSSLDASISYANAVTLAKDCIANQKVCFLHADYKYEDIAYPKGGGTQIGILNAYCADNNMQVAVMNCRQTEYSDIALMTRFLAVNYLASYPTAIVAKGQQLPLCQGANITSVELSNILSQRANVLTQMVGGKTLLREGTLSNPDYFIDDWINILNFKDYVQAAVYDAITGTQKMPYSQEGFNLIGHIILKVAYQFVTNGVFLQSYPTISDGRSIVVPGVKVQVPLFQDVTGQQRAARQTPPFIFNGMLAGAIQNVTINLYFS